MYEEVKFKLVGEVPGLLVHNVRLADPLDEYTKALAKITRKKKKTEEDHIKIGNIEFMGGLYLNDEEKPILPADVIHATFVEAAKNWKLGKVARGAIMIMDDVVFMFSGPKKIEKRLKSPACRVRKSVRVGGKRVFRTRPLFQDWSCVAPVMIDTSRIEAEQLFDIVEYAGRIVGFCDHRPLYGRFNAELVD